jgi:glycosyltransferase involved in cell wall biosynthesis
MRILLINQYAGAPQYGMEYRPYYLAREWQRLGHEITILGGTFSHLRFRNPPSTALETPELVDGIRMAWVPLPSYRGNGLARARNILTFALHLLKASGNITRRLKPEIVITSSTHPLDVYGGRRIAQLADAIHIHEVHDLWPETLIELGHMQRWHPFVMLLQAAENHAYRRADRVISMLPQALPYMRLHGLDSARFRYVPNGVATMEWEQPEPLPTQHADVLDQIKARGKLVVGYSGGFALSNDLRSFLNSLGYLRRSDVHVVLVGDGQYRRQLQTEYSSDQVTFLEQIRKPAVPSLLARFDLCFLGLRRSPLYRFGVNPNKLFDYMMAARPIISAIEATNDPVGDSGAGLTVRPEDPSAIATAIEHLASESTDTRRLRGERGRSYVLKHHDYRVLAEHFLGGLA